MLQENMQFDFDETQSGQTHPIQFHDEALTGHSLKIHQNAVRAGEEFLIAEAAVLNAIIQVDLDKTYLKFKLTHLTPYCIKYMKLSPEVAGTFVRVARKSLEVPALQKAVDTGLCITKAKTIVSVLTPANQSAWIEKAQDLSKEKLEKEVAKANPFAKKPDRAKATGQNRTRLEFELNDDEMAMQRRVADLVSRKLGKSASLAEVQRALLENYLKHHDPVKKAERASARKERDRSRERSEAPLENFNLSKRAKKSEIDGASALHRANESRTAIPSAARHTVNQRDRGQCQARLPDGSPCHQTRWVDQHHIIPRSKGGADVPENLTTLCSAHHRMWHQHN